MRIESSVTSISWIPSEAIIGMTKLPFSFGVAHYDEPPPDEIDDLAVLQAADRFRFANELRAWIDVVDGQIVDHGHAGGGRIGSTTLRLGAHDMTLAATAFSDLRPDPEPGPDSVTFVQTAGGKTGAPAPRWVNHPPFVKVSAPTAWTTLELTINADGTSRGRLVGASPFPRHWIYDQRGKLIQKSGLIEFKSWYRTAFGSHSPWGDEESPAFATAVETALERQLSTRIMRGGVEPKIKKVAKDKALVKQGDEGHQLFVLLDGVIAVEVDGEVLAECGPGAVLGERALIEDHRRRTATLRAVTKCKVAVAGRADIAPQALAELSEGHRREEQR
ncbi:MAG: cyclic nucleotide-binding domain-containing protein [Acidimicrobiia bacterium]